MTSIARFTSLLVSMLAAGLAGCDPGGGDDDTGGAIDAAAGGPDGAGGIPDARPQVDANVAGLHGTPPTMARPAPAFSSANFRVKNRDGSDRQTAALIGKPTVMWFYPAATTGG